jgi:hypothetical protein
MINLGIITPNPTDACSWYRTMGPWTAFRKQYRNIEITCPPRMDWAEASKIDVAYMQRPYAKDHGISAMILAKAGTPLWVDFDDDLWNVPAWNPAHKHFENAECKRVLKEVCMYAKVISVTTEKLAQVVLCETGREAIVLPNALNDRYPIRPHDPARMCFWWRGGKQHRTDHHWNAILFDEAAKLVPDAEFLIFGDDPFWTDNLPRGRITVIPEAVDVLPYHEELLRRNPSILLYGLEPCTFNESKSACSWLEATMCGSVVVGPAWDEWKDRGVFGYEPGHESSLRDAVRRAVEGRLEQHKNASAVLNEKFRLSTVNSKRFQLLTSLVSAP